MNGNGPPGVWQEARHSDGRIYYYHTGTKQTQWDKPDALKSAAERAVENQPWKEYTAEGGRKYWYHAQTKETTWEMPEVYQNALNQSAPVPQRPPPTTSTQIVAGSGSSYTPYGQDRDRDDYGARDRPSERYGQSDGLRGNFVAAGANEPDYSSIEDAEAAFMKLLKRSGAQTDWSWEQAMRATVKDPQYRAIKDPKDRKAAFEKYVTELKVQDKEREKERVAKLRQDFGTMLRSHPEIKYYTRWKTARPIVEGETIFRSTVNDTERRQLFEEYILDLRKAHSEKESQDRSAALSEMSQVFENLNLEPYTRWSDAQGILDSNERYQNDDKFRALTKSDVLTAFENHVKALERTLNDQKQMEKARKGRAERQNRDRFIELIRELKNAGKIKAGTKWVDVHPLIEQDERYQAMLGQEGSTPLDFFWDVVEEQERVLRAKRNDVLDVLDDERFEITPKTPFDEFLSLVKSDRRTSGMDDDDLQLIFNRLIEKVNRRNEEDKHQHERSQRRAVDNLRSRIKHLDPPLRASDTWADVEPRIEKYEEYQALESDELRRSAFEKVIRRIKEKEADAEYERTRRSDRDLRNGHRGRRERHSRTPEIDAYEADRRKAQADREKSYRKASGTGLSPPLRGRDRYDGRAGRLSGYDRERRDRELERERSYVTRADPRDRGVGDLDYGESGRAGSSISGSTGRRRRDSDIEDDGAKRDNKRVKRDRRSKTPREPTPAKEEEALKSGSEEGEIEED